MFLLVYFFTAMKDHGNFPPHIREEFVYRDIDEQM